MQYESIENNSDFHAEICPVCNGTGIYKHYRDYKEMTNGVCYWEQTCHGCNGKGWVQVPNIRYSSITR